MAKFEYRGAKRTAEDVKKQARASQRYDSLWKPEAVTFKPKEGENLIRVLPPTWDDEAKWGNTWEIRVWSHFNIGADEAQYLCLEKMLGERCPICEARKKARSEEERDELRVGERPAAYIIDRNDEQLGPQIYPMPLQKVFSEICNRSIDRKTGTPILIDDPDDGFDISFYREGKDKRTQYTQVEIMRDPTPLHDNLKRQDKWLQYIMDNPLPEMLNYFPAEHIEAVLLGQKSADKDDDDDDVGTRRGRSRRGRSVEKDEEEDPKPSSRRRRTAEPEEDEEEDPKPSTRRRAREPEPEEEEEEVRPRRRARTEEPEPEADERPARRRAREPEPEEEEEEVRPRRRARTEEPEDEEEDPSVRKRKREYAEDEEEEKSSRRRVAKEEPEEEEEEDERPSSRRGKKTEPDPEEEEEEEKPARRRRAR